MSEHLPIVDRFISYLNDERHFSPYTGRCYGLDLRQYTDHLRSAFDITCDEQAEAAALESRLSGNASADADQTCTGRMLSADLEIVRGFIAHLGEQNYSAATMARKIATLRSFHKWMERKGLIKNNPMVLVRTPKQAKRLPKAITVDEIERLLSAPDDMELLGARDRAILEVLYSTGIRVSEVVGINRGDVNLQDEALVIEVDAPFYADPAPKGPPGSTWALWEHEVVEVFLMGQGESYTEVELGPHGHHLVLRLLGRRNIVERELPIEFEAHVEGDRWKGRARVPNSCLPDPILRLNAYAIHGTGAGRIKEPRACGVQRRADPRGVRPASLIAVTLRMRHVPPASFRHSSIHEDWTGP